MFAVHAQKSSSRWRRGKPAGGALAAALRREELGAVVAADEAVGVGIDGLGGVDHAVPEERR